MAPLSVSEAAPSAYLASAIQRASRSLGLAEISENLVVAEFTGVEDFSIADADGILAERSLQLIVFLVELVVLLSDLLGVLLEVLKSRFCVDELLAQLFDSALIDVSQLVLFLAILNGPLENMGIAENGHDGCVDVQPIEGPLFARVVFAALESICDALELLK